MALLYAESLLFPADSSFQLMLDMIFLPSGNSPVICRHQPSEGFQHRKRRIIYCEYFRRHYGSDRRKKRKRHNDYGDLSWRSPFTLKSAVQSAWVQSAWAPSTRAGFHLIYLQARSAFSRSQRSEPRHCRG